MNTKVILVLLCAIACCLAKRKRGRKPPSRQHERYPKHGRHSYYNDYGYDYWKPQNHHYRPFQPHELMNLPPFMTVGFPYEEVTEEPEPTPSVRPDPPAEPLNKILSTLSDLPLSLYNNYICNMFGNQEVSPNITPKVIRQKRALFGSGFFRMFSNFRRVIQEAYQMLKPFHSGPDDDLLATIQDIALSNVDFTFQDELKAEDVVKVFLEQDLQAEGIVGSPQKIFEAIQQLAEESRNGIEESTQEAVDNSCGIINNEFYCNYMKKLVAKSDCSGSYFSTEILDRCCSAFVNEVTPVPAIPTEAQTTTTSNAVPTTTSTVATTTTTQTAVTSTSVAQPVTTPTTVAVPTTSKASPTTTSTAVPTTELPTTTVAPVTTTVPQTTCGISSSNPATRFTDFSSAMNQVRIVGGVDADKCEYPWMVRLQVGNSLCGGTIIDETHILTAGHCIDENTASDITVHVGEYDYNTLDRDDVTHTVKAVDVHPNYTEMATGGVEYDVAVLTLDKPITYTDCAQPICLPSAGDGAAIEAGTQCVVAGWGTTSSGGQTSNILQEVTVPTYSGADCSSVFSQTIPSDPSLQLCAGRPVIGGADSCQGDSGGPLFCPLNGQYVQYGVVSYGAGCADAGAAGIYADTSAMLDFINGVTSS